jgi:hypothetical protein
MTYPDPIERQVFGEQVHVGSASTRPIGIPRVLKFNGGYAKSAPARGPPLWWAAAGERAENDPQWDQAARPGPEVEFDQRIACEMAVIIRFMQQR